MSEKKLSTMEIDAIGEILNISLGASATAVSTMLDARVDITTPVVRVEKKTEFFFAKLKPAVAVEINYVEGLSGKNVMLLKRSDVKAIVEMLMGITYTDEEFELNELNISAICEVMNQMMGASATALSELFGRTVNISTPQSFEVESEDQFKDIYFTDDEPMAVISFKLTIGDKMESEFMNLMSIDLAKELVGGFFVDGLPADEEETESVQKSAQSTPETAVNAPQTQAEVQVQADVPAYTEPAPVQPQQEPVQPQPVQSQQPVQPQQVQPQPAQTAYVGMDANVMNQMLQTMQMMQQQMMQMSAAQQEKKISVTKGVGSPLKASQGAADPDVNLDLLMSVPMELSVEIGRTKKLVKDILELNKGTLVVLDRVAGEPVDLYVNGECIAKGDVVVVDDNFGIRITEILKEDISADI